MRIRIGHTPEPDDVFLFHALTERASEAGPLQFEFVVDELPALLERARRGELELASLSLPAWAEVSRTYAPLRVGGRFVLDDGPVVVSARQINALQLPFLSLAVPDEWTTGYVLLRLVVREPQIVLMPQDAIADAVLDGQVQAGLLVDEGQVTYPELRLEPVLNLGRWWYRLTHLPLPIGLSAVRRDLPPPVVTELGSRLAHGVRHALDHRDEAIAAAGRPRGLDAEQAAELVELNVNAMTLDPGPRGLQAIRTLLSLAAEAGALPKVADELTEMR